MGGARSARRTAEPTFHGLDKRPGCKLHAEEGRFAGLVAEGVWCTHTGDHKAWVLEAALEAPEEAVQLWQDAIGVAAVAHEFGKMT